MPLPTLDARHVLALMGFLSTASEFMSRADLSIAIVAMVGGDSVNMGGAGGASGDSACSAGSGNGTAGIRGEEEGEGNTAVVVHNKGEFDWDPKVRGDLLGSYYYGNALTQILAGWMAMKFGFKKASVVLEKKNKHAFSQKFFTYFYMLCTNAGCGRRFVRVQHPVPADPGGRRRRLLASNGLPLPLGLLPRLHLHSHPRGVVHLVSTSCGRGFLCGIAHFEKSTVARP